MKKYMRLIFFVTLMCIISFPTEETTKNIEVFSRTVKEMGYDDVSETPYEVVEFTIPMEFNEVYTRYNELLKTAGYDLSPYKGKCDYCDYRSICGFGDIFIHDARYVSARINAGDIEQIIQNIQVTTKGDNCDE